MASSSKTSLSVSPPAIRLCLYALASAALLAAGATSALAEPRLATIVDVPLPGRATRFDYQSFDPHSKRLYFTHMGDGALIVFDTVERKVVAQRPGLPTATGVLVVPELRRVFVSVAGRHEVAVVDTQTLELRASVDAGAFPDGLAYAPEAHKVFVSDEARGLETVIDTDTNRRTGTIDLGGEIGNTRYEPTSHRIIAAVQSRNEIVEIDPRTEAIVGRHHLEGGDGPHGLLVAPSAGLLFAACENDARLLVVELPSFRVKQALATGRRPDVLAFDPGLRRLYVATESGVVSIFELRDRALSKLEDLEVAAHAHTISVLPDTHDVYLPLQSVGGHPVLRIMRAVRP